jgi:hypothetical protein
MQVSDLLLYTPPMAPPPMLLIGMRGEIYVLAALSKMPGILNIRGAIYTAVNSC